MHVVENEVPSSYRKKANSFIVELLSVKNKLIFSHEEINTRESIKAIQWAEHEPELMSEIAYH